VLRAFAIFAELIQNQTVKDISDIQLTSERTDWRVARLASVVFMMAAWLFVAALFVFLLVGRPLDIQRRETEDLVVYCVLLLMLAVIPIHLWRYFRQGNPSEAPNANRRNP
jgi:hypothetical protein